MVLCLGETQAARRAHRLEEVDAAKGLFRARDALQFKVGEVFGCDGDMGRAFTDITEPVDEGEWKQIQLDRAAALREAAAARAQADVAALIRDQPLLEQRAEAARRDAETARAVAEKARKAADKARTAAAAAAAKAADKARA